MSFFVGALVSRAPLQMVGKLGEPIGSKLQKLGEVFVMVGRSRYSLPIDSSSKKHHTGGDCGMV